MEYKYKYQMHTHTAPCSCCAPMTPAELIEGLLSGGYQGCVITNHFYGGNTGIDRDLSWNDFVKEYERNYLECKEIAKEHDLDIIFSIEEQISDGLEILCYGVTPQFLYDHPELQSSRSIEVWSKALRDFGALCIQAHPFRNRSYIINPRVFSLEYIDGIEVFNAGNQPGENKKTSVFANENPNLILTSGGDSHIISTVCLGGIITNKRIQDEKQLVDILKSKNYELIV